MNLSIDEIIENGTVFNLFREAPMNDIRGEVRALFAALHSAQVDYVLVGGLAMLSYVEVRNTQGVNVIIDPKELQRIESTSCAGSCESSVSAEDLHKVSE
jgi:hypothetical protein